MGDTAKILLPLTAAAVAAPMAAALPAATSAVASGALSGSPLMHAAGMALPTIGKAAGSAGIGLLPGLLQGSPAGEGTPPVAPPPTLPGPTGRTGAVASPPIATVSPGSLTAQVGAGGGAGDPTMELLRRLVLRR